MLASQLPSFPRVSILSTRPLAYLARPFPRSMATAAKPPLPEWLVIIPDHEGVLEKRVACRNQHLANLQTERDDMFLWGGAMLREPIKAGDTGPPKMYGSAMLVGAHTKEEVVERLKSDLYVAEGVWNWDKVQIIPFRSALRKAL